ncbi:hypothetical protein M670_03471 [Schinkia azotoformans MEV2011]|uniref:Uncharacterized protein n=1 Tax=Schinkia azotoformans MEV2011 TaxID=1348973 RepID=A0A072NVG2_SCHAZ|nr:hypothetical protein [Schinkia azotoformans]KEF37225.1 hypothetical protein M670_03471 [Schinkia azotoformans MEV2011]MEC1697392.1 hypothetical protein [Schinkia azotoformans]MEC1724328.1 hypothetical protein [Schinkia azotoformans]MEC1773304.1 hypothetical protein [Schinkia azotoformans]MED4364931.1 hypothetical protein [Schinkia azotoformans]
MEQLEKEIEEIKAEIKIFMERHWFTPMEATRYVLLRSVVFLMSNSYHDKYFKINC